MGLIAQDLEEIEKDFNVDYLDLVFKANPSKLEIKQNNLITPMIKALQQLIQRVELLEEENKSMKTIIEKFNN